MSEDQTDKRARAIELAARFALIGEDAMVSVARADIFLDFLNGGKPVNQKPTTAAVGPGWPPVDTGTAAQGKIS